MGRRQRWPEAARQAKVAFPCSACGSTAACISQRCRNATASAFRCRDCALSVAWLAGRFGARRRPGSLAICPAGFDCAADVEESADTLVVAIDPSWFSLAAAEDLALEAQLIGCLFGYDQALLDLAHTLALENADDYPNGPLFWNEIAGDFIDNLLARHTSEVPTQVRGMLGKHRPQAA